MVKPELLGYVYSIPYPRGDVDKFVGKVADLDGVESIRDAMSARPFMILEVKADANIRALFSQLRALYRKFGGAHTPK